MNEKLNAISTAAAAVCAASGVAEAAHASGTYKVQCHEYEGGPLLWEEEIHNLVTTAGGNNMLDNQFSGSSYTAAWYLGLISTTSYTTGPAIGDTSASHAGWTEDQNYSQSTRPAASWNSAASKSKALSSGAVFTMNATTTIKGCFLINNSTKGGSTGVLYSAGLFSGGDQPVVSGNTLTVSYTASV
jgi:hypothetical protein